jgi:hypothetical protein
MASVSGRRVYCSVNPRAAYREHPIEHQSDSLPLHTRCPNSAGRGRLPAGFRKIVCAGLGVPSFFGSGAARPMKMGTTASPWRYDAEAFHMLQLINLRMPAILRSAQIR